MISDFEKQITQKEVVMFLSSYCGVEPDAIHLDSNIATDLNMEGDDAIELLEEFEKRFSVDMTGVNCNEYFVPESYFNPLTVLWKIITKEKRVIKPLYVKDLIDAAIRRKWLL